jgi:predicted metalloprotease
MRTKFILLPLLIMLAAACGPDSTKEANRATETGLTVRGEAPEGASEDLQLDMDRAAATTENYWIDHWSDFFTGQYVSPRIVGLYDGRDETSAPLCNGEPLEADNAYYCPDGDFVAWDVGLMLKGAELGDAWVYLVIAHEWGHAIQARLDRSLNSQRAELQADCLAGAVLYGSAKDGTLTFESGDEKELVRGLSEIADETPWTKERDHGDAFERVGAFREGRDGGVSACLPTETN